MTILGPMLPSTSPRLRGILNFQMFVLCKASLGIIAMLEGKKQIILTSFSRSIPPMST